MIFFDIDGTLMDHAHAEAAGARAIRDEIPTLAGIPPEEFVTLWHGLAEKHMDRFLAGETDKRGQRRSRLTELFAAAGERIDGTTADATFARYLDHYERNWRLYPDVADCLDLLGDRPLGIISNGDGLQQRKKLERMGIAGRFAVVAISEDTGAAKPETAIFAHACGLAAADPADCVYVGDRAETDAQAAETAGLLGVHLDRRSEGGFAPRRITSLAELPALLGGFVKDGADRKESP